VPLAVKIGHHCRKLQLLFISTDVGGVSGAGFGSRDQLGLLN
jgi:hypothetical protein